MFQCKVKFQFVLLHMGYNFQHFELIEYVNKLYGYRQYKMHGNVINVLANVDQTQSILSRDETTICVFFKCILSTNHLICKEMFIQIW
jgi:hypothetical protein